MVLIMFILYRKSLRSIDRILDAFKKLEDAFKKLDHALQHDSDNGIERLHTKRITPSTNDVHDD